MAVEALAVVPAAAVRTLASMAVAAELVAAEEPAETAAAAAAAGRVVTVVTAASASVVTESQAQTGTASAEDWDTAKRWHLVQNQVLMAPRETGQRTGG